MISYIISMDIMFNALYAHIISIEPFGEARCILTCYINSPSKLKQLREMFENFQLNDIAEWFKHEYNLTHTKITIAYGPEIRKWLSQVKKNRKQNKEKTNEI